MEFGPGDVAGQHQKDRDVFYSISSPVLKNFVIYKFSGSCLVVVHIKAGIWKCYHNFFRIE